MLGPVRQEELCIPSESSRTSLVRSGVSACGGSVGVGIGGGGRVLLRRGHGIDHA